MNPISTSLIREIDFSRALIDERDWEPDLAPKQLIDETFPCDDGKEYGSYIEGLMQAGLTTPYADLLTASKWRLGRRPLHIMPLSERVFYRGLVKILEPDMPAYERTGDSFKEFELGPQSAHPSSYVIKADIADYFSTIDHELLVAEIINRSGRREVAQALCGFWRSILGRNVGIPQMSEPSKRVSELLADTLQRNLVRRGIQVWRYADDFRIVIPTKMEAAPALDALHEESRALGLSLNDWKTHVLPLSRYLEITNEPEQVESNVRSSVIERLTQWNPYTDEGVRLPDEDDVWAESAKELLAAWAAEKSNYVLEHSGLREKFKLIRTSLDILSQMADSAALPYVSQIMSAEPQLTAEVCRYLRNVAAFYPVEVRATVSEILSTITCTRWQRLWLVWVFQDASLGMSGRGSNQKKLADFSRELLMDRSEFVRSNAMWALACHEMLSHEEWAKASESMRSLGAPYAAASLAGTQGLSDRDRKQLIPTSKLEKLAMEHGALCIR